MILVERRINPSSEFIRLDEATRLQLVSMSRDNRYASRIKSDIKYEGINVQNLASGRTKDLDVTLKVSGKYKVTVRFEKFMIYLVQVIMMSKNSSIPNYSDMKPSDKFKSLSSQRKSTLITSGVIKALDSSQVRLHCECSDFRYRFAYKATQSEYNLGFSEDRPTKRTNPNEEGSVCKHLAGVLTAPSKYQKQVVAHILKIINYDPEVLNL